MFNQGGMGFDESLGTSPELEALEDMDMSEQALELDVDLAETGLEGAESIDALEQVMDALGLTEEEKQVYQDLVREMPELSSEATHGKAKVHLDCASTTCTYTTTSYYCAYTK